MPDDICRVVTPRERYDSLMQARWVRVGLPFVVACVDPTQPPTVVVAPVAGKTTAASSTAEKSTHTCRMTTSGSGEAAAVVDITVTMNPRNLPTEVRTKAEKQESTFVFSYDGEDRLVGHRSKESNGHGIVNEFDRKFFRNDEGRIDRVDTVFQTNHGYTYRYSETVVGRDMEGRWTRIETSDKAQAMYRSFDREGRIRQLVVELEGSDPTTQFLYEGDARDPTEESENNGRVLRISTYRGHQLASVRLDRKVTTYTYEGDCPNLVARLLGAPRLYFEN